MLNQSKPFSCTSQAGKPAWIKIVQERTKNTSYKLPQVPKGVALQHFRAGKVYDDIGSLLHKRKDWGINGFTGISFMDDVAKWA
ncbi:MULTISPECIES: hypothetical protein [unclassified Bartonella]|uniref:hypothetical protein n=1 Tax=unclassified Bartonella TaxID=2645622 RepID=UPI0035D11290